MSDKSKLHQHILDFLEYMEVERQVSPFTVRNYAHYLERFRNWFEGNKHKKVEDIDLKTIKKYRLYLSQLTTEESQTLTRVTQSYHVIALRSFLKWLTKNDYDVLSPHKVDLPKGESRSLKFLNEEQIERLLACPSISTLIGLRDKAMLELLFSTGLRVSELVNLNRDQIDFLRQEFSVIGKGRRARVVFMSDRAAKWVKMYFDNREDEWEPAFVNHGKKAVNVDLHSKGEKMRLSVRTVQRTVKKYAKKANLAVDITPHGLRHTFATDLLSSGAGLREVQELLGHKNIATTQIYTHVTNPQLKQVHKKFHSGNKD